MAISCNMEDGYTWTVIVLASLAVLAAAYSAGSEGVRIYRGGSGSMPAMSRNLFIGSTVVGFLALLVAWIGWIANSTDDDD